MRRCVRCDETLNRTRAIIQWITYVSYDIYLIKILIKKSTCPDEGREQRCINKRICWIQSEDVRDKEGDKARRILKG